MIEWTLIVVLKMITLEKFGRKKTSLLPPVLISSALHPIVIGCMLILPE